MRIGVAPTRKEVSIIIPAFNEEEAIGGVIDDIHKAMDETKIAYEIIVVDDASEDGTMEEVQKRGVRLIEHPFNRGYGASLKTGIRQARYSTVVITDADGTYSSREIPRLLEDIPPYDMIVGARIGAKVRISFLRRLAKGLLTLFASYLTGARIPDLNSGLRAFRKEIALEFFRVLPSGFSFTTSITLAMLANDYLVKYIPIDYFERRGKSKIRPIRDTLNFATLILRTVMYYNPLKVFVPLSLFFSLVGLVRGSYNVVTVRNLTTADLLLLMMGVLIGMLGLLADLVDKRR